MFKKLKIALQGGIPRYDGNDLVALFVRENKWSEIEQGLNQLSHECDYWGQQYKEDKISHQEWTSIHDLSALFTIGFFLGDYPLTVGRFSAIL